jgi:hypothetical protein
VHPSLDLEADSLPPPEHETIKHSKSADNKIDIVVNFFIVEYYSTQKYIKISAFKPHVEKIVEKIVRLWKKMENYTYLCVD